MYIPREREITLRRYGKYVRATDAPKPTQNDTKKKGGKREADQSTPKNRSNSSTSEHKALAIALNNDWHWYGHLYISKEDVTDFDDVYKFIGTLTNRLQRMKERTEEKNFHYMIVPDFEEQGGIQKWFLHIWLMNVPNPDKAFTQEPVSGKKIIYHWNKYERQNGRSELYKIYSTGYTTNGKWQEKNAFQIFDIMERTASIIPKNRNLYYSSNGLIIDDVIAKGAPSEIHTISNSPWGNNFVRSEWFISSNLQKNIEDAKKYFLSSDAEEAWVDDLEEEWVEEEGIAPVPPEQQGEGFFSYDSFVCEGEYVPPADDYFFCDNTECYEPVEDFDYSILNDIYENEVYNYD
mgnify:CR=1 FL=1